MTQCGAADDAEPSSQPDAARPRAGRPRDGRLDRAILEVTERLLMTEGYDDLTIEAVAEQAGVSRPTVYRRWPDKAHLVLAAVASHAGGRSIEETAHSGAIWTRSCVRTRSCSTRRSSAELSLRSSCDCRAMHRLLTRASGTSSSCTSNRSSP